MEFVRSSDVGDDDRVGRTHGVAALEFEREETTYRFLVADKGTQVPIGHQDHLNRLQKLG